VKGKSAMDYNNKSICDYSYNSSCSNTYSNSCNNNGYASPLKESFFSIPPRQYALLSTLLGILLIGNLDLNQQNSLGNFIVNVGQAILTAAAQGQALQNNSSQDDRIRKKIEMLKKQIGDLEKELDR